jgi:hypothetical protein
MNIVPSLTITDGYREPARNTSKARAVAAPACAANIWRKIKNGFRALMEEEDRIVQQGGLSGWCYAHINCPDSRDPGGSWVGSIAKESLQARFELLATEAAIALGSPAETIPHVYWLHRLLLDLRGNDSNHVRFYSDTVGIIERLFEASAVYCTRLERLSLEEAVVAREGPIFEPMPKARNQDIEAGAVAGLGDHAELGQQAAGSSEFTEADATSKPAGRMVPMKDAHLARLEMILQKNTTTLEKWASSHKLGRTSVFDWKFGRRVGKSLKGKVSREKSAEIEGAIDADAAQLGLTTRTDSD